MNLGDILQGIDDFSEEATILAQEPWSPSSRAVVREFPVDQPVAEMIDEGRTYFLEVSIAREVIEDLRSGGGLMGAALYERVIRYASDDA